MTGPRPHGGCARRLAPLALTGAREADSTAMGPGTERVIRGLALLALVGGSIEILAEPARATARRASRRWSCSARRSSPRRGARARLRPPQASRSPGQSLLGSHATDVSGFMLLPFIGTIFIWGLRAPARDWWGIAVLAFGVGYAVVVDSHENGDGALSSLLWVFVFMLGGPIAAGRVMRWRAGVNERLREQAEELERNREARARAARLATRSNIARELHDIVAHEVSVMVVQAQAARLGVQRGSADAGSSIETIETTGREALTQMRRLLGVLRHEDDRIALAPQPSLRRVDVLVEQARARGLEVRLAAADIAESLPPGVDLTAYRIAQEALQSATDHGHASRIEARIATRTAAWRWTSTPTGRSPRRRSPACASAHRCSGAASRWSRVSTAARCMCASRCTARPWGRCGERAARAPGALGHATRGRRRRAARAARHEPRMRLGGHGPAALGRSRLARADDARAGLAAHADGDRRDRGLRQRARHDVHRRQRRGLRIALRDRDARLVRDRVLARAGRRSPRWPA